MGQVWRSKSGSYFVAVVATVLVILARLAVADWLSYHAQLLPFVVAVMAAAWCGGLWPGLLATALGLLAGCYFFVPPQWSLALEQPSDGVYLGVFAAVGVLISSLCEALHAIRRRLESKQGQLEHEVLVRQQAEQALRLADRRKSESLAILAHELRNMLAPVNFALFAMEQTANASETVERHRQVIDRHIRQMTRLIEDLLSASRMVCNKLELRKERVALEAVVQKAVESSYPLMEAGAHELVIIVPAEPVFLDADPTRLTQVFTNLLNNAAKYTERGGHIRVSVERQGRDAIVRVSDNGIGIAANDLPRLFDMFMQVERLAERSGGGLGIGLSLVQRLVDLHGGSVAVHSDGLGCGSEFVVRLPALGDAMSDDAKKQTVQVLGAQAQGSSKAILRLEFPGGLPLGCSERSTT